MHTTINNSKSMTDIDLNLLFAGWLEAHAAELTKKGSKLGFAYSKAHNNVKKHPDRIENAKQLRLISCVGQKTFEFLCGKLKSHCQAEQVPFPSGFSSFLEERVGGKRAHELDDENTKKKPKRRTSWVPKRRSGSWAILIALHKNKGSQKGLRKEDIIASASEYCDVSFTANPAARDFYSAWDGIKTLLNRELVEVFGRAPKLYQLTEAGVAMAKVIMQQEDIHSSPAPTVDLSFDNGVRVTPELSHVSRLQLDTPSSPLRRKVLHDVEKKVFDGIPYDIWNPEDFEVAVLFDTREMRSQTERDFFQKKVASHKISCDVRALSVGDVLWIAKHKHTGKEVVLNYVCERKRIDDLAISIKDGRFVEQKNRLLKSALRNVYYIVEEGGLCDVDRILEMKKSIQTAISMVMTVSNLYFERFRKSDDIVDWVVAMTDILKQKYSSKRLLVLRPPSVETQAEYSEILLQFREKFEGRNAKYECVHTFPTYQAVLSKSDMMTVKEMFILMLMLVRGISLEKAVVIQNHFQTPRALIEYYQENANLSEEEKKSLLAKLFDDQVGNKKVGKAPLAAMYETWGKE